MPTSLISPAAWIMLAVVIGADAVLCLALGLSVKLASFSTALIAASGAFALAWFYTAKRPEPPLAMMAMSLFYLVLFTALCAVLSYASVAFGLPLLDAKLAALDARLGLDWMALLTFVDAHPLLALALQMAYAASLPHVALAALVLSFNGDHDRLRLFLMLFAVTGATTCVLSGLLPAAGAFVHYAPADHLRDVVGTDAGLWHLTQFNALRDGTMTLIDIAHAEGLVTFPSFHTALAIVCGWATWRARYVAWPSAVLAGLIVASTPSIGGHHFVDIFAGAAIAFAAIWLVQRQWSPRAVRDETALASG